MSTYRLDPGSCRVWFDGRTNLHPVHGEASGLEGSIEAAVSDGKLDLSTPPQAHVELSIDRLRAGNPMIDREMQRRLEVRRYPRAIGELREVSESGSRGYRVVGELTLHGVSRRLEVDVDVDIPDDDTLRVSGEHEIDIRDFGIDPPRLAFLKAEPGVHFGVEVVARREP